jgi:hypothetical protein
MHVAQQAPEASSSAVSHTRQHCSASSTLRCCAATWGAVQLRCMCVLLVGGAVTCLVSMHAQSL